MTSTAVSPVQRLHQHRAWVNEHLLAATATLSDEQLRRSFQIGQGSILKSLLHRVPVLIDEDSVRYEGFGLSSG